VRWVIRLIVVIIYVAPMWVIIVMSISGVETEVKPESKRVAVPTVAQMGVMMPTVPCQMAVSMVVIVSVVVVIVVVVIRIVIVIVIVDNLLYRRSGRIVINIACSR